MCVLVVLLEYLGDTVSIKYVPTFSLFVLVIPARIVFVVHNLDKTVLLVLRLIQHMSNFSMYVYHTASKYLVLLS